MAIIITGNPGVGKHTIAKSVSKILHYKILDINKIALDSKIYEKNDESNDVDVIKLKNILKNKIKKDSIVVGHLAPYVVTKKQVTKAIILRKNPYKLTPIYKKRKYSTKKIAENIGSEILGIIAYDTIKKFGKNKCHQIDTTSKTVSKITKTVINIIEGKVENDTIDWLTLISNKNDLKKFFSY
ncbi:MAG TPA: AAA family ATPase [Nitrosopumilaceae archaeon]|nr:AAA family ATPase [Nitrosopumilaceae archaeon]